MTSHPHCRPLPALQRKTQFNHLMMEHPEHRLARLVLAMPVTAGHLHVRLQPSWAGSSQLQYARHYCRVHRRDFTKARPVLCYRRRWQAVAANASAMTKEAMLKMQVQVNDEGVMDATATGGAAR